MTTKYRLDGDADREGNFFSKVALTGFTPEIQSYGYRNYPSSGSGSNVVGSSGTGARGGGMNGGVENGEPNVSYGLTSDGYPSTSSPSPCPGADGLTASPNPDAMMSVQELAALKHAEAMHLACKAILLLVRHRGSHLKNFMELLVTRLCLAGWLAHPSFLPSLSPSLFTSLSPSLPPSLPSSLSPVIVFNTRLFLSQLSSLSISIVLSHLSP